MTTRNFSTSYIDNRGRGTFWDQTTGILVSPSSVEYLVIAGGGGGGWGAGGAGGYRTNASFAVSAGTPYTVTIGSGGTAGGNATPAGS
jgi:hypothetical protein